MQYSTERFICLGPTGNIQGSHWFLNLRTERRINQRTLTSITAPPYIITGVYDIADEDNQKIALNFCDSQENLI